MLASAKESSPKVNLLGLIVTEEEDSGGTTHYDGAIAGLQNTTLGPIPLATAQPLAVANRERLGTSLLLSVLAIGPQGLAAVAAATLELRNDREGLEIEHSYINPLPNTPN